MVLMNSCCFLSIRKGSYVSAVYTLIFYTFLVTAGTFHIHHVINIPVLFAITMMMIVSSAFAIAASILLLIGISGGNKALLLPWIVMTTLVTIIEFLTVCYLLTDAILDPFFIVMVLIDVLICVANVYCLLCVITHYIKLHQSAVQLRRQSRNMEEPYKCSTDETENTNDVLVSTTSQRCSVLKPKGFDLETQTVGNGLE